MQRRLVEHSNRAWRTMHHTHEGSTDETQDQFFSIARLVATRGVAFRGSTSTSPASERWSKNIIEKGRFRNTENAVPCQPPGPRLHRSVIGCTSFSLLLQALEGPCALTLCALNRNTENAVPCQPPVPRLHRSVPGCTSSSILPSSLELSDAQVHEPSIRALLGTAGCTNPLSQRD